MRAIRMAMAAGAAAIGLAAAPAQAAYHVCWALNIGDGYQEALVSNIFTRPDGEYSVGIVNDWVSWMNGAGWHYSNSSYGCLGPYDTWDDADYARSDAISDYDYSGYALFYPDFGG